MTYQVELHKILTPSGDEYILNDGHCRWLLVTLPQGAGLPSIDWQTDDGFLIDREILRYFQLESRSISLQFYATLQNRAAYFAERARLLDVLKPNQSRDRNAVELTYVFTDGQGNSKAIKAVANTPTFANQTGDQWLEAQLNETLELECFDPVWFDPTATTVTMTQASASGYLVFPIVFPIQFGGGGTNFSSVIAYEGSWSTYPTFIITGENQGWVLRHAGLNIAIVYNRAMVANEQLTLDLADGTLVDADGNDRFLYLSPGSNLIDFKLYPDPELGSGLNGITLQGIGGSTDMTVQIQYQNRYIGF